LADSWDETKRAAQSVFNNLEDIGQIINQPQGGIYNPAIAEESYEPTLEDWKEYERYSADRERENPPPEPDENDWREWVRLIGRDPDAPEPER
jgi:hypothetical protein